MKKDNIEVEVRSFINDNQYKTILLTLDKYAEFLREVNEETVYFSGDKDLRLRKNKKEAFLILKEGKIHDNHREEFEIRFDVLDFEDIQNLLKALGFEVEIKWFRKRREYKLDDIKILLDDTKGYGKIIELEKMVSKDVQDRAYKDLENRLKSFNIKITSKDEFNKSFEYYKKNWEKLIK